MSFRRWIAVMMATPLVAMAQSSPPTNVTPQDTPTGTNQQSAEVASDAPFNTVDDLLTALEQANADLHSLVANIGYTREYAIAGDVQVRYGKVVYEAVPTPPPITPMPTATDTPPADTTASDTTPHDATVRRFAVHFDTLVVSDRVQDDKQSYIFDGQWLVEKWPADRQFIKRQVVRPGETFDPLRLGQGPFPVPINQRRSDILARFEAELLPATADLEEPSLTAFVAGSAQLRLVPRPGTDESDQFEEVRLWYRPAEDGLLLPLLARTLDLDGDVSTVQLLNVETNIPIDPALLDTTTPGPDEGWDVDIQPWRQPIPSNG